MNNLLYFKKRMTQKEAHDSVSERHRVEDVDNKTWWKSVAIFWACIILFMLVMGTIKYATACDDLGESDDTIKQIRVDRI